MIRDAIASRIGADTVRLPPPRAAEGKPDTTGFVETGMVGTARHASQTRLPLLRSGDDDGMCLIEPAVRCTHCGYCLSLGH